jgi:hypothetical protein
MNNITEGIVTVFIAIVGVAIISVLVSKKAQTPAVIQSVASGFGNSLGVAISPVTGNQYQIDLSYPGNGSGMPQMGNIGTLPQLY